MARLLHRLRGRRAIGQDHVRRQLQQLRGGGSYPIGVTEPPLKIDLNIAADDPAKLLESFPERRGAELSFRIVLGVEHQHADPPHALAPLRARRERPRGSAADERDELAPFQRFKWHPSPRSQDLVQRSEIATVSQELMERCDNLSASSVRGSAWGQF